MTGLLSFIKEEDCHCQCSDDVFFLSPRLFIHWLFYSPNWKFVLRSTVWWYPENITTKCNGKSIEATLTVYINKTVCLVLVLWCLSFVEVVWLIGLADPIKRFVWLDFIQPTQSPLYTKLILSFVKSYILNSDQMKKNSAQKRNAHIIHSKCMCNFVMRSSVMSGICMLLWREQQQQHQPYMKHRHTIDVQIQSHSNISLQTPIVISAR